MISKYHHKKKGVKFVLRIRMMKEAYEEIKKADPRTAITMNYIRRLVISGAVPSIRAGSRYLINMEELEHYLANPKRQELDRIRQYEQAGGKIRRIAE
jgi:excisionase family DNA binding protein